MKPQLNIISFLQELVARYTKKSPLLFKWIQGIAIVCMVITGVPDLLTYFGVALPEAISILANKTIAIASLVSLFISGLPVDQSVLTTEQKTESLTFTTSAENKNADTIK